MRDTEREARIDLAAAYRMACHHGLNEGGLQPLLPHAAGEQRPLLADRLRHPLERGGAQARSSSWTWTAA